MKTLLLVFLLIIGSTLAAQERIMPPAIKFDHEQTRVTWMHPDKMVTYNYDFNEGQLPDGWSLESIGSSAAPWQFESHETNPNAPFPAENSTYLIAKGTNDYVEEYLHIENNDSPYNDMYWAYIQFDYALSIDNYRTYCNVNAETFEGTIHRLFNGTIHTPNQGFETLEIPQWAQNNDINLQFRSYVPNTYFAIDNVSIWGETDSFITNDVQGFRMWLNGTLIGETEDAYYDFPEGSLDEGQTYEFSVAAIYSDGVSEAKSISFTYHNCNNNLNVKEFEAGFVDDSKVSLSWKNFSLGNSKSNGSNSKYIPSTSKDIFITHENAGYHKQWDISSLHCGLTTYGYNADHDKGYKVMDKFTLNYDYGSYLDGLLFFVYQGPTTTPCITGAYVTVYDGDPLNGGEIISGNPDENVLNQCYFIKTYRTNDEDFDNTERPIMCVETDNVFEFEEGREYYVVASFTSTLNGGIFVIPTTILGEIETGEAMCYSEENGWQPMLDQGTNTRQGIALGRLISSGGAYFENDYVIIYKDGVLAIPESDVEEGGFGLIFDEDVTPGHHIYGIRNFFEGESSCIETAEVWSCSAPENLDAYSTQPNNNYLVNHIVWEKEADMPENINQQTSYIVFRKADGENDYTTIGAFMKEESNSTFEFCDTVTNGTYLYKVKAYNVYEAGFCESGFAHSLQNPELDYVEVTDILSTIEQEEIVYNITPNPTKDIVKISGEFKKIEVFNAQGQKILSQNKAVSETGIINMESFASGIYFFNIMSDNGMHKLVKVVKN